MIINGRSFSKFIKSEPGVYVVMPYISPKDEVLYVGESDDVRRSLQYHEKEADWERYAKQYRGVEHLAYYCDNKAERQELKRKIIHYYDPIFND